MGTLKRGTRAARNVAADRAVLCRRDRPNRRHNLKAIQCRVNEPNEHRDIAHVAVCWILLRWCHDALRPPATTAAEITLAGQPHSIDMDRSHRRNSQIQRICRRALYTRATESTSENLNGFRSETPSGAAVASVWGRSRPVRERVNLTLSFRVTTPIDFACLYATPYGGVRKLFRRLRIRGIPYTSIRGCI